MRSGSHVQLAALRNRDLELQTTSPFSNHGSVEWSTACFRHKNVNKFFLLDFFNLCWVFQTSLSLCLPVYIYIYVCVCVRA